MSNEKIYFMQTGDIARFLNEQEWMKLLENGITNFPASAIDKLKDEKNWNETGQGEISIKLGNTEFVKHILTPARIKAVKKKMPDFWLQIEKCLNKKEQTNG